MPDDNVVIRELQNLISNDDVQIIGPVRQELLSGIRSERQFNQLKSYLSAFADLELTSEYFETAARHFNTCRAAGIQGSNTDFLICAVSTMLKLPIFTIDRDFLRFAEILPIGLHQLLT